MTAATQIRVLVVDDHSVVRMGLRTFISVTEDLDLVGEASNGEEAIERCEALLPDVVLMDLQMPIMDGPTAIGHIRHRFPEVGIVALTSYGDADLAKRAMEAGALGFLLKDTTEEELVTAIRLAAEGRGLVAPHALQALISRPDDDEAANYRASLTEREQEVLVLMARGLTNPQIGNELSISRSTANFHVQNVLNRLGARTRTEAVSIAVREGLIEI